MNIQKLKESGLNIFSSTEIKKLPNEILENFNAQKISFSNDDTLCVVGSGGRELWQKLIHPLDEMKDPFDRYTITQLKKLDPTGKIIFPHPSWNIPLQKICRILHISKQSPIGIDIHREFGLWFSIRGVFITTKKGITQGNDDFLSPCETCETKNCISACPANAIPLSNNSNNQELCNTYQLIENSNCENLCLARRACPFQNIHQYTPEQTSYHIRSRNLIHHK